MALPIIVCVVIAVTAVSALENSKGCMDQMDECHQWAIEGECQSNPLWMGPNCPLSCGLCDFLIEHLTDGGGKCSRPSKKGDIIYTQYNGTLLSTGKQFDSNLGKDPYRFELGAGHVIKGMDLGVIRMCLGDKRKLTIPSELAYGSGGYGDIIPGGATLVFEVQLVRIEHGEQYGDDQPEEMTEDKSTSSSDGSKKNAPGCRDQMLDCVSWAKDGECKKNPVWMKPNCPVSCGLCNKVVKCIDLYKEDCVMWKKRGECTSADNRIWMFFNCPKTCGTCNIKFEG